MTSNPYYINVYREWDHLYIKEVRDGKRHKIARYKYKPTLYVKSDVANEVTKFKAPDGTPVKPVRWGSMGDCYKQIKKLSEAANFEFWGNTNYEYAFINEAYPGHLEYDMAHIVVCNLDIEVDSKNGYCEPADATNEITAITMKSSVDGIFHVFGCKEFDDEEYNRNHTDSVVVYHQCQDEIELLDSFLCLWETLEPDILIGYNCLFFDVPYLINRMNRIMRPEDAKRLSLWGIIKEGTKVNFNKEEQVYEIAGVAILDYLVLYKKNVLEPRESYKLDYIAEVELGEHKVDYGEYGTLQDLYEKDYNTFIIYNIHDVRLVDRIDAKRKLIELQLIVAYHAKVNYVDVHSPVKVWDTNICNHLLAQKIVVPQRTKVDKTTQFIGAYVMKPIPGMYEWVASFDVQSLYPMIMRTLNIGMESKVADKDLTSEMRQHQKYIHDNMLVGGDEKIVNPDAIVNGMTDDLLTHIKDRDVTVGANGVFYRREPESFYSMMIDELFQNRLQYKKQLKAAANELSQCTDAKRRSELETEKVIFDLKQGATKILLNSLFGYCGNAYARFYDLQNAEAITTTGQFIIQFIGRRIEAYLNKQMQTTGSRFVICQDTDSVYVTLNTIVAKYHPQGDVMEKCAFVDTICKEAIQPEIDRLFRLLTTRYMNGVGKYLLMNREVIGDKGIWTAKKRYLINVRDKEGIKKNPAELKIMGLEIKKATVPKFCRDAMEKAVRIVMDQDQPTLFQFVKDTYKVFVTKPIEEVSFPRSVNGLVKYGYKTDHRQPTLLKFADELTLPPTTALFTKKTPVHTKGALAYNRWIEQLGITNHYPRIKDGEKIKFFFLIEPNPFNVNAMAFINTVPKEFRIEEWIDWDKQFTKSFTEPLMLILRAINWDTEPRAALNLWTDDDVTIPDEPEQSDENEDNAEEYDTGFID